jgi:two-component system invasion response regulator UvrY
LFDDPGYSERVRGETATRTLRVAIADDHPITRCAVRSYLGCFDDIEVVAEAASGRQVIDLLRRERVDVLLLDLDMPGQSGLDAMPLIRAKWRSTAVLVFSAMPESRYAVPLIREGASGFLNKSCPPSELLRAVRHVGRGGSFVTPEVAELLAGQAVDNAPKGPHEQFSAREFQVFLKLARGRSTGTIARELSLSVRTVSSYRARIGAKLDASTPGEITSYALKHALLD